MITTIHKVVLEASMDATQYIFSSNKRQAEFEMALDRLGELHNPSHTEFSTACRYMVIAEFRTLGAATRYEQDLKRLMDSFHALAYPQEI